MKNKVLLIAPLYDETQQELESLYTVLRLYELEPPWQVPQEWCKDCAVVVTHSSRGVDAGILKQLPQVKLVANFGTGVDKIDLAYCAERSISVTHTPDVLTDDVAHLTLALMLDVVRGISASDRFVRAGKWRDAQFGLTRSLKNMRVGIVGLGRIGQAIAALAVPLGCEIAYTGPNRKEVEYQYFPQLTQLAQWAEILVVSCLGGPTTDGLVTAEVLQQLGPDGYIINVARGSVIDESALVDSLLRGIIGGAGLDVYADEPNIPAVLLTLDNVVLVPHLGSATDHSRKEMGKRTLANVAACFAGEPLPNIFGT